MILITGSRGLIGRAIADRLRQYGHVVRTFDIAQNPVNDIRDPLAVELALNGVEGIIHLAAVSRIVWAEADPARAWATNVDSLRLIIEKACAASRPPWIVFGSSREVYGEPASMPVAETAEFAPGNVYARSKVAGEELIRWAGQRGVVAQIARFSNVYGSIWDHHDRVAPAFARAAAAAGVIRIEGPDRMFDFTHVRDVARGLHALVDAAMAGKRLDPIHFVTGNGTTLGDLANIAVAAAKGNVRCEFHEPRCCGAARFRGDPDRAKELLGWTAEIDVRDGFLGLVEAFRMEAKDPTEPRNDKMLQTDWRAPV